VSDIQDLQQSRIFDADGHVHEDLPAIVDRLTGDYREFKLRQMQNPFTVGGPFPPLGFLSNMPNNPVEMGTRGERERGNDPESWEYFLDAVGIERTVLYPTSGLGAARIRDAGYAVEVCRAYNDWIAETYVQRPHGRFQAAALLPLQAPEAAVTELNRVVKKLGFCAAVLPSHGLPNHLGSPQFFPIYEAAQNLGVGLSVHGGIHDGFGFDDFNVFTPAHALGHPFGLLISLGGLLFNGVFEKFPELRMAFLEGGSAWILLACERFSESFKAIRPPTSEVIVALAANKSIASYISDLMQDGRIVLGCEGGEAFLEPAIEYLGCSPFMYSSDFPHEVGIDSCKHELAELDALKIDEVAKQNLRSGTAIRFYRQ
jgi:uncharacterized protein